MSMTYIEFLPIVLILALFSLEALYGLHYLFTYIYARLRPQHPPPRELTEYPPVTVQIAIYNEGTVIEPSLRAISELDYPREKLQIQICDDSTEEDTIEICRRWESYLKKQGFSVEHVRRDNREGYKAGNLNNALKTATGDFIVVVDADFILPPDFLKKNLPIFLENPEVGIIQSHWKHLNRDANILTRALAAAYDMHLEVEQLTRSNWDLWLEFNGSGGIWRKKALEDIGGWPTDVGVEDVYASLLAQEKGWKAKFLKYTSAYGRLPETLESFLQQQNRWAMGCGEILHKHFSAILKMKRSLSFKIISLFHIGGYFVHVGMLGILLLSPLAALSMADNPQWAWLQWPILILYSTLFIPSSLVFKETDHRVGNTFWEGVKNSTLAALEESGKAPSISLRFVSGLMGGKLNSWVPTHAKGNRKSSLWDLMWMGFVLLWSSLGIIIALKNGLFGLAIPVFSFSAGIAFLLGFHFFSRGNKVPSRQYARSSFSGEIKSSPANTGSHLSP